MADILPAPIVTAALIQMGLMPVSAQRAARDSRITWTDDALEACQHDIDHSGMASPAGALWNSYLLQGQLPPLPKVPPLPNEYIPLTSCPICTGDLAECHAVHGIAATLECWQCHKPMNVCCGTCQPAMPTARRTTRNKRKDEAA